MSRALKSAPRFRIGDWASFDMGTWISTVQIIEDRGNLGKNGRRLYRIRQDRLWTEPFFFEVPEDELQPASAPAPPPD